MRGVAIIESPGLRDITTGDRSGLALAEILRLLRVPYRYQAIHSKDLLKPILLDTARDFDVVHLSAHGKDGALSFTDGSVLSGDEMQWSLLPASNGRIVALDACGSSGFEPADNLAVFMQAYTEGVLRPPKCVLTMYGNVTFGDSALSWALFYRHLWKRLLNVEASRCQPRAIHECLLSVKNADLHKICAAFWYDAYSKYVSVSPWLDETGDHVAAIERGEDTSAVDG